MLDAQVSALVAGLDDLPDQHEQARGRTARGPGDRIKCNFHVDDAVVPQHGFMFGEDLQWPVVLRADDDDDGAQLRILALVGCNAEAVTDALQDLKGKPCFQQPDRLFRYDTNTVETRPTRGSTIARRSKGNTRQSQSVRRLGGRLSGARGPRLRRALPPLRLCPSEEVIARIDDPATELVVRGAMTLDSPTTKRDGADAQQCSSVAHAATLKKVCGQGGLSDCSG
jgi:hypothetical protein